MRVIQIFFGLCLLTSAGSVYAEPMPPADPLPRVQVVRLAELHIDPAFVEPYRAALVEEIQTSIEVEPGVLTLYAVSIKGDPTLIRIFKTYADMDAYYAHIQTPHFLKYKNGTEHMIRDLTLLETDPILLGART